MLKHKTIQVLLLCLLLSIVQVNAHSKERKSIKTVLRGLFAKNIPETDPDEIIDFTKKAFFKIDNKRSKSILIVEAEDVGSKYWHINIVDITGRMVAKSTIPREQNMAYFDTRALTDNIYIIKVFDETNLSSYTIYFTK